MDSLIWIFTLVAQILIICGGIAFLICFGFGAKLLWEMMKLSIYTSRLIHKWSNYKKIPVEGREEADKSGHFEDDTSKIK